MGLLDSDIKKLQPAKTKYVKSAGEGVLVEVHPQGYKYFKWEYKFPPGKDGKRKFNGNTAAMGESAAYPDLFAIATVRR